MAEGSHLFEYYHQTNDWSKYDHTYEFTLYSDAHITGEVEDNNKHCISFINIVGPGIQNNKITPSLILRIKARSYKEEHSSNIPDMNRNDTSSYHGGDIDDEVSALLCLVMGARFFSEGKTRVFEGKSDSRGTTDFFSRKTPPPLNENGYRYFSHLNKNLEINMNNFNLFFSLNPEESSYFIKAARIYQQSLWSVERDANIAWLQLVSSIEAIAQYYYRGSLSDTEILESIKPEWAERLKSASSDIHNYMAKELKPLLKSQKKFVSFLIEFMPEPPRNRPDSHRISWEKGDMENGLKKIYNHRSKALHEGTPFPFPLCAPPTTNYERPPGLGFSAQMGVWREEELPMTIPMFEYIVRGALFEYLIHASGHGGQKTADKE